MTVIDIDLGTLIHEAWKNTLKKTVCAEGSAENSNGNINSDRSSGWIDCLGTSFQGHFNKDGQCVFWKKNDSNRKQFNLNELLFDISVCRIKEVLSISQGTLLPFVSKCYWQIESELNNQNSREITKDFSKLVMGKSDNKLFISSYQGSRQENAKVLCSKIARYCTGSLYLCFIDHPEKWAGKPESPVLFRWDDNDWKRL